MNRKYKMIIVDAMILFAISGVIAAAMLLTQRLIQGKSSLENLMITTIIQSNKEKTEAAYNENKELINQADENGRTPLMWVAYINFRDDNNRKSTEEKRVGIAKFLIEKGADIKAVDNDKWSTLHWAAWSGLPAIAEELINAGIEMSGADKDGNTPLMLASIRGNADVAKILVEKGADKTLKNKNGKTALELATENKAAYKEKATSYDEIISILQ